ncbi:formimidoyltransferase-cyclodeaminase-like [Portunus trituberculatus]|uniref:formimidoyltransferase-cyclodeaminase-like n=1 Tax=Portunus trituberculatus TaxID=210409 RepID=UPI001E1D01E8|nr:formimidoyltransferase-cyclodeaminase-like [Portunus trituberculatus]
MTKIVECVPNFSEGRDKAVIEAIAGAVRACHGVKLLDVDPGASTNRTVYTFVGGPDEVVEAALAAARVAFARIDMTKHKGSHPRMGALDVCPFIPVRGVTQKECVAISATFGRRLAKELGVPVYLYGAAATKDFRTTLPQIRAGEYEGLKDKLIQPKWEPDFGSREFVPRWGATVTGVRKFLIAYNVNLLSTKEQAHRIALNLREQGRGPTQTGRLRCCQAIGWYLEEQRLAQISINLTDYDVTPMHVAFEEAKKDAAELKIGVMGSEVVGLVPLAALLQAAEYYIAKEELFILEEEQKVQLAINRLGLSTLSPFNPKERIIEYCVGAGQGVGKLGRGSVEEFVRGVAARTPAPGGGSVAATVAAMGAALGTMVGQMTFGKRQWEALDATMRRLIPPLHQAAVSLLPAIDADTAAFNAYMDAVRLPQGTEEEKGVRERAVKTATEKTIQVPLSLLKVIDQTWEPLVEMATVGNMNCRSDLQVGARCLEAGAWGAYYNVLVNLDNLLEGPERNSYLTQAEDFLQKARRGCEAVLSEVEKRVE